MGAWACPSVPISRSLVPRGAPSPHTGLSVPRFSRFTTLPALRGSREGRGLTRQARGPRALTVVSLPFQPQKGNLTPSPVDFTITPDTLQNVKEVGAHLPEQRAPPQPVLLAPHWGAERKSLILICTPVWNSALMSF